MGEQPMTLWLARHARPLVAPGTCYGMLDLAADAELTQAAALALARELPQGTAVQVSPLQRCQQLADALNALRSDLHFRTDSRLREMDFGYWEGVLWSDIPRAAVDAWTADFAQHRFGGQESANEVLARVALAWDELQTASNTLWIAHSGVAQAAALLQQGVRHIAHAKDWPLSQLSCGAWQILQRPAGSLPVPAQAEKPSREP
jgi:alpha-ribazole phosphatase